MDLARTPDATQVGAGQAGNDAACAACRGDCAANRVGAIADGCAEPAGDSADAGMSTVEYAIGTVVAAAFAAVLYRIVTGDSIVAGLTNLVQSALNTSF